jgi:hypothetical protein
MEVDPDPPEHALVTSNAKAGRAATIRDRVERVMSTYSLSSSFNWGTDSDAKP